MVYRHSPFKLILCPPEFRRYEHLSGISYPLSLKIINKVSRKEPITHHSLCAHFLTEGAGLNLVSWHYYFENITTDSDVCDLSIFQFKFHNDKTSLREKKIFMTPIYQARKIKPKIAPENRMWDNLRFTVECTNTTCWNMLDCNRQGNSTGNWVFTSIFLSIFLRIYVVSIIHCYKEKEDQDREHGALLILWDEWVFKWWINTCVLWSPAPLLVQVSLSFLHR